MHRYQSGANLLLIFIASLVAGRLTQSPSGDGGDDRTVLASLCAICRSRGIPVLDFIVQILRATDKPPSIAAATLAATD